MSQEINYSILVVCLNAGQRLLDTIDSIINQTYQNYEIIIKDGESTDGSVEQVKSCYAEQMERIRIISQRDSGIYDAMNQACTYAKGDYYLFLNTGDSFYDEYVLEKITDGIVEKNIEISSLWREELESLRLVDEDKLAVTIAMKPFEKKSISITPIAIEIRGLAEHLTGSINLLSVREIHVTGKEESIKELTLEKLAPYIDLSGFSEPGVYTVPICLENLNDLILEDVLFATVEVSLVPQAAPTPTAMPEGIETGAGTVSE